MVAGDGEPPLRIVLVGGLRSNRQVGQGRPLMRSFPVIVVLAAFLTSACSAGTASPTPSTDERAVTSPSASESPAVASAPAANPLIGRWATGQTTCAGQNAALQAAGITADQMAAAGWSLTCATGMPHGTQLTIYFSSYRLVIFQDGEEGWDGEYRIVDDQTFEAGDEGNGYYITYSYVIDGDQLKIDMLSDDCPVCSTGAEVAGEQIAQTVIFETSPFTRMN